MVYVALQVVSCQLYSTSKKPGPILEPLASLSPSRVEAETHVHTSDQTLISDEQSAADAVLVSTDTAQLSKEEDHTLSLNATQVPLEGDLCLAQGIAITGVLEAVCSTGYIR